MIQDGSSNKSDIENQPLYVTTESRQELCGLLNQSAYEIKAVKEADHKSA